MDPQGSVRSRLRAARRSVATALHTLRNGTDYERWRNAEDPARQLTERNALIGGLVPAGSSVLDLGAGRQELRRHLPSDCEYQACDLFPAPGVLTCDFNAGTYPAVDRRFDILVASGLVEFLRHPIAYSRAFPSSVMSC